VVWRGAQARERDREERGREDGLMKGRRKEAEVSKVMSLVWKSDRASLLYGVVATTQEERGVFFNIVRSTGILCKSRIGHLYRSHA
jgi:hypothetical protein